jgi:hypothetical protein
MEAIIHGNVPFLVTDLYVTVYIYVFMHACGEATQEQPQIFFYRSGLEWELDGWFNTVNTMQKSTIPNNCT